MWEWDSLFVRHFAGRHSPGLPTVIFFHNSGQYCCRALESGDHFLFLQPFWYHFVERRKGRAPCSFLPSSPWPWLGLIFSLGIKTLLFFGEQELVIPSSDFDRCNLAIFQLLQSRICTALHCTPRFIGRGSELLHGHLR